MTTLTLLLEIKRKAADLPRFVVLDQGQLDAWQLAGTTPVLVSIENGEPTRRNIKRWGKGTSWWFFDLTADMCRRAGVDTGDVVQFTIANAANQVAAEIEALLADSLEAAQRWDALSDSQRRMLNEHVLAAKQASTRERRARKALRLDA